MSALGVEQIRELLVPYGANGFSAEIYQKISRYLSLFELWSSRVNLSTVREPEQVVQRHFGEGFVLSRALPACHSVLDLGSGAGFPGLPIALYSNDLKVTLAESQNKKAAFLREAVFAMELEVSVWPGRAEELAAMFDVVVLRAVDNMPRALKVARGLLHSGGTLAFFVGGQQSTRFPGTQWVNRHTVEIPYSAGRIEMARLAS